jgi:hypothetical protein
MRRVGHILGAGAILLCVACGQNDEIGFGGVPPMTTADRPTSGPVETPAVPPDTDPMFPRPPAGVTIVPEAKVDSSALPNGYPRVVWTEGDGTTIGVFGQAGGCTEATAEMAEQTTERVIVVITETTTSTGPCTMEILYPPLTVKLDAPLGDRTVVLERTQIGPR